MSREIRSSDIKVADNLYVAANCVYNRRYRRNARDVAGVVIRSLERFRKYLDFPPDVVVRVCSIKGLTNGRYHCDSKMVELDCNMSMKFALEILAHELVHAEQYHQGRLKQIFNSGVGWGHAWHGSKNYSKGTTYRAYRKQPWEIEAWDRQAELAEKVSKDLEIQYE